MTAEQVLSLTPRELTIMMEANNERIYDDYEHMAVQAFMIEKARRSKRLKLSDLFERPTKNDQQVSTKSIEERRKEVDEMNDWLATLTVERKG